MLRPSLSCPSHPVPGPPDLEGKNHEPEKRTKAEKKAKGRTMPSPSERWVWWYLRLARPRFLSAPERRRRVVVKRRSTRVSKNKKGTPRRQRRFAQTPQHQTCSEKTRPLPSWFSVVAAPPRSGRTRPAAPNRAPPRNSPLASSPPSPARVSSRRSGCNTAPRPPAAPPLLRGSCCPSRRRRTRGSPDGRAEALRHSSAACTCRAAGGRCGPSCV